MNKSKLTKIAVPLCIITLLIITYRYIDILEEKTCPLSSYQSTTAQINGHKITVEIALTEEQRNCGLAQRSSLPDNHGMLFVFDKNQTLDFWMKDTYIPLTVAYINENHQIMELHQFTANQTSINAPSKSVGRYALESSPEWFLSNDIRIGDYVEFSLP